VAFRGVANVRYLTAEDLSFELSDGISIRGRVFDELTGLGFSDLELQGLADDWSGFGASSYVMLVAERRTRVRRWWPDRRSAWCARAASAGGDFPAPFAPRKPVMVPDSNVTLRWSR